MAKLFLFLFLFFGWNIFFFVFLIVVSVFHLFKFHLDNRFLLFVVVVLAVALSLFLNGFNVLFNGFHCFEKDVCWLLFALVYDRKSIAYFEAEISENLLCDKCNKQVLGLLRSLLLWKLFVAFTRTCNI